MIQESKINLHKVYESSYSIYCRMFDLVSLKGTKDNVSSELYALRDSDGVLSKISFKILISTRKAGLLNALKYRQYFDNIFPKFLMDYGMSERLYRVKAEGWRNALSMCTENNINLTCFLLDYIKSHVETVVNTSIELRHYTSDELEQITYHRVVTLHDKFFLEWNRISTLFRLAFLYQLSENQQIHIRFKLLDVYQSVIYAFPPCFLNVFLYTQFKDDINTTSVQFPQKTINTFQLEKYVIKHIESILIPQQLIVEYEFFRAKITEYNKSDQLD